MIYKANGVTTSYSEMMGLPKKQRSTTFYLPGYNNKTMNTELRIANVSTAQATVHVMIGGIEMTGSPFTLAPGASMPKRFFGINTGPVKIESNVDIVVSARVIYKVNGVATSYSELMGLPSKLLDTAYWFPWYNNVGLNTQLRFGVP